MRTGDCKGQLLLGVMEEEADAKVLFRVPNDDGTAEVETLCAFSLGQDRYKLDNCPFYAYSVSLHDIVYAPVDADEGCPIFQRIVSKSGNRTVRVIFDPPVEPGNRSAETLDGLVALGCEYEGANRRYMAINVPPMVELTAVQALLVEREAEWEHADPSYAELYPDDA